MIFRTLKFIVTHPLNRNRRIAALSDWFRWQVGSRLLPGAVEVPFVNNSVLMVEPGMTGATGNIYVGLAEFEDMSFLLHFLRPDDLFIDIGANVGAFTVLASKAIGAKSIAVEALPATHVKLIKNIGVNNILSRVDALNCALGEKDGEIHFTAGLDTMNHVVSNIDEQQKDVCSVSIKRLDDVLNGQVPKLIKIDVEGYETSVIQGALRTLQNPQQEAVIMELNGCGKRYGFDDIELHQRMVQMGYSSACYDPFERKVSLLDRPNVLGNTLYLRNARLNEVSERLKNAVAFQVKGREL